MVDRTETKETSCSTSECSWRKRIFHFFVIAGPGCMAMLADTDAGSIVTAAQSGALWGYRLLWLQLLLIPILYFVQELTVRLGFASGKGQGSLIQEYFGRSWGWFTAGVLYISAIGALVTEFIGISGAGLLFHIPPQYSVGLAVFFLLIIVLTGSYRRVELIGIAVGLFEITLVIAAYKAHPDFTSVESQFFSIPIADHAYFNLIAANVGAVIMPWMIFYQQAAIVDKGICCPSCNDNFHCCRLDTALGSVFAQIIMASALVLAAATIGRVNPNASLHSVQQIADSITPLTGDVGGKVLFAVGITSAALIASIVVSLAASWGVSELLSAKRSLNMSIKEAPRFYTVYGLGIVMAGLIVFSGLPVIDLIIGVEILNALMLPLILGFLFVLAFRILPTHMSLKKWEKALLISIYIMTSTLSLLTVINMVLR